MVSSQLLWFPLLWSDQTASLSSFGHGQSCRLFCFCQSPQQSVILVILVLLEPTFHFYHKFAICNKVKVEEKNLQHFGIILTLFYRRIYLKDTDLKRTTLNRILGRGRMVTSYLLDNWSSLSEKINWYKEILLWKGTSVFRLNLNRAGA